MSGEVCESCQPVLTALVDKNAGLEATLAMQAHRIGKLTREDKDWSAHEEWARAEGLFKIWKRLTGHTRSRWTVVRFKQCLPFLSYSDEQIVKAITGLAHDPFVTRNLNGTEERHDWWDTLFNAKKSDNIERYANKCPANWKATLEEYALQEAKRY